MDRTRRFILGILTVLYSLVLMNVFVTSAAAVVLCKYSQAEWNTTKTPANRTVSCDLHDNCTDSNDDHKWSGHFSKCPKEYKHYCIHGVCRFVKEQNTPSCRCETGYIGTRCEYRDLDLRVEEQKKIIIACVVAGLVFLILLIVFICVCTHKRYKPCRKKKRKTETSDEDEKLSSLNTREALAAPVDTSDTNAV